MSDNKREQERNELYRTIWTLANELRGSVDGWDFKQYVLGILFYRLRMKNREIDLLIVVNMFLTGFDATTLG